METKESQMAEIQFSAIDPLELWTRLGLQQPKLIKEDSDFPEFENEEEKNAYLAFEKDLADDLKDESETVTEIEACKGSLFIWAVLKQESKRSKRLSSTNHLFKDDIFRCICSKSRKVSPEMEFDETDFDEISKYLEDKRLVRTSRDGIRITRDFEKLFHSSYEAWLVF